MAGIDSLAPAGRRILVRSDLNVPLDGTTITESVAICRYLESRYPEPNLFGRTPEETALVEMWMRRGEFLVSMPLMMMVRHSHPALAALEAHETGVERTIVATGKANPPARRLYERHGFTPVEERVVSGSIAIVIYERRSAPA